MADSKISELTALTTPASDDVLAIVDTSAGVTKKITISNLATSSEVVDDTSPQLGGDLASNGSDILFADNDKAMFGAGSDLNIYHNGSNSIIEDTGSGDLVIKGSNNIYMQSATGENYLRANSDGAVTSYFNNAIKLATTSTGIDVTGTVTADGLTVDNITINGEEIESSGGLTLDIAGNLNIDVDGTTITLADGGVNFGQFYNNASGTFNIVSPTQDKDIVFRGNDGGSGIVALTLDMSDAGAATFNSTVTAVSVVSPFISIGNTSNTYQTVTGTDNGNDVNYRTYANHIWKNVTGASSSTDGTERMRLTTTGLGIGTTSPNSIFEVRDNASPTIRVTDGDANNITHMQADGANGGYFGTLTSHDVRIAPNNSTKLIVKVDGNVGIGTASPASELHVFQSSGDAVFKLQSGTGASQIHFGDDESTNIGLIRYDHATNYMSFNANSAEAMRIDSSGNLLVGTTDAAPATNNDGNGISLRADGGGQFSRNNAATARFNRGSSDGAIMDFHKDGTTVGSIGVDSSDNLFISGNSSHAGFEFGSSSIVPYKNGASIDDAIDLGGGSQRFDDIYATNGTIQTSDRNEKQDIENLSEAEVRVAVTAKSLLKKYRWKSAVKDKGDDARIHFGIIAQDLQDAFTAEGLDAGDYGMFISNTWTDEDGVEQTRLGVRYSELLAFIITTI